PPAHPPPGTATAPRDTGHPAAHTPRLLSGSPAALPPSLPSAPHRCLLLPPVPLPVAAGSEPTGSRARSTPGSSPVLFQRPTPPLPASAPPAARKVGECTAPVDTRPSCRSTPPATAGARPPSAFRSRSG